MSAKARRTRLRDRYGRFRAKYQRPPRAGTLARKMWDIGVDHAIQGLKELERRRAFLALLKERGCLSYRDICEKPFERTK
jgi:hypothetical protein